jgi:hypothetical protein
MQNLRSFAACNAAWARGVAQALLRITMVLFGCGGKQIARYARNDRAFDLAGDEFGWVLAEGKASPLKG